MGDASSRGEPPLRKAAGWAAFDFSFLMSPPAALAGLVYAIVGLASLAIMVAGGLILFQFVFQTLNAPPKDFEDISRRLLAVGLIVAAPFAIWRIVVSHWQARAAQAQAAAAARQADVAREEHYTTLFTAAVQQLGAMREVQEGVGRRTEANTEARLGAIYALERIAQDSERDHWSIMETLCAYVRKNRGAARYLSEREREQARRRQLGEITTGETGVSVDVQAALTVIGRRSPRRLSYEAGLREKVKDRTSYRLDLTRTNLSGAVLTGNFDYANFERSSLALARANGASFNNARFFYTHLEQAEFTSVELRNAVFIATHLEGVTLRDANADGVQVYGGSLEGSLIVDTTLSNALVRGAEASGASIVRTTFEGAEIMSSDFTGVRFDHCVLTGLNMSRSVVNVCNFRGVNCASVTGLTQQMIDSSFGDAETVLPNGLTRPARWPAEPLLQFQITDYHLEWLDARTDAIKARRQKLVEAMADDDIPF